MDDRQFYVLSNSISVISEWWAGCGIKASSLERIWPTLRLEATTPNIYSKNKIRNGVYKTLCPQHMFACKDGQIYKVLKFQNNFCNLFES